jgi:hypothetical protein
MKALLRQVRMQSGTYAVCFLPTALYELQATGVRLPAHLCHQPMVLLLNGNTVITVYWYQHLQDDYRFGCPVLYCVSSLHSGSSNTLAKQGLSKPNDQHSGVKNSTNSTRR